MGICEGASSAASVGPGLAGKGWIFHGNGMCQSEGQCWCGHPFVCLGLWPCLEGLWGSGFFGFGFVPTNGNGDAFGTHQIVTPPGCVQQQGLMGTLAPLALPFKCSKKGLDSIVSIVLNNFEWMKDLFADTNVPWNR